MAAAPSPLTLSRMKTPTLILLTAGLTSLGCTNSTRAGRSARRRQKPTAAASNTAAEMATIELTTLIRAPSERCFDLSRSVDLHVASTTDTGERAVGGVMSGLLSLGEEVTWSARHFGVRQELTSRITAFERPRHFRDSMVAGAFRRFDHDHFFVATESGTEMKDVFDFESPLGPLGRLADALVLTRYLRGFLERRNEVIKRAAESEGWRALLPSP